MPTLFIKTARVMLTAAFAFVAVALLAGCGDEKDSSADNVAPAVPTVSAIWVRATAPKAETGAAYLTISSATGDKLLEASVPSDIAGRAELHETTAHDDAMSDSESMESDDEQMSSGEGMMMRKVDAIEIPANEDVKLEPGGFHVMLFDLKKQIKVGDTIDLRLTFEKAGLLTVAATAKEA